LISSGEARDGDPARPANSRALFWITTLLAIGLAEVFFFSGYQNLIYDAWGYYKLSQNLAHPGFVAAAHESRTYGYPLFVAICSAFRKLDPETVRFAVFHVQLLLFLTMSAAAARRLGQVFRSDGFTGAAYSAMALNPFLLIHTTETLSDSLSADLVFLAVILSIRTVPTGRGGGSRVSLEAAASLLCASLAVMVRPANLAVLLAVGVLWLARQFVFRELRLSAALLLLAVAVLPFLPQLIVNYRSYGRFEPLLASGLYRQQASWGMAYLKYRTLVRPGDPPQLVSANPLYHSEGTPRDFLRRRPAAYLATLGVHLFAMLDHDLPFTYVTDPRPWYRWPLSVLNYGFLFLSLGGIVLVLGRYRRVGVRDTEPFAVFALLFASAAYAAVYLPTAVESRFSLSLDLLLTPFFVAALLEARDLWRKRRQMPLAVMSAAGVLFVALCAILSSWIAAQAPRLPG
jgi:hypothetical protein